MPFLSLVVPVHRVQGYLRECLDSILGQSFTDLEVIAVDDASPDHCGAILDSYHDRDPRVRVLHLPSNVGLGPARNAGLDQATGEYVWFVDSDDWLPVGALHAIATRLGQTAPDLLMVDHTRVTWLGQHQSSDSRDLLRHIEDQGRDGAGVVDLAAQPDLLTVFTVAWNKVVRRRFLLDHGLRFDHGWYEDLPFTFPVLVAAERIAAVSRVCYHYRKGRGSGITQTRSRRHFEVFDQWRRVFERLDQLGDRAEPFRPIVADRMLWHLLVVESLPDRLPAGTHREFFRRITEFDARYRSPRSTAAAGPDRLRRRLVAADAYRAYQVMRRLRGAYAGGRVRLGRLRRRGRQRLGRLARLGQAGVGRASYAIQRRLPVDRHLAVYAAYWYRGVACNPAAIHDAARRLVPHVRGVWVVDRAHRHTMPGGVDYVVAGTPAYYRALARAAWLINNVNFPDFVVKRPGTTHVHTHHGTPVKVMGLDQGAYPLGAPGIDLGAMMRRSDRWDVSVSANAHSTQVWARSYPCGYRTIEAGYPRNDRLVNAGPADIAAVRADLGAGSRTVVLYAPTHREYLPTQPALLDAALLADRLGPDALVVVRAHYFYRGGRSDRHPRVLDRSEHPQVEDLLLAADILVTDYSSVMFDFAVLDRPIVLYAPDWETYRRNRGVTFDLLAEPPGVVARDEPALHDAFRTGAVYGEAATQARAQFRARFCSLEDGRAAERVVRDVFAPVASRPR